MVLTTSKIQRQAFWLRVQPDAHCFSWLHVPTSAVARRVGVIIAGPVGPEYMHSHRSIRFLADQMAAQGFVCLRYDPLGMGNSSHELSDANLASCWVNTLAAARDLFRTSLDINEVVIIGLRSGALIAHEFLTHHAVQGAIFWYPYLKGSAYVRDLQIIDSMLHMESSASQFIEGGGYPLFPPTQAWLESIDLLALAPKGLLHALIINNAAQAPTRKLQQALAAQAILAVQQNLTGLERMMKQSEITEVPEDNISAMVEWLRTTYTDEQKNNAIAHLPDAPRHTERFHETVFSVQAERTLVGVMLEPSVRDTQKPLVVFVNGGSGHHVGPNRLYVDICRRLADEGFSSVRLDLSNLGDSAQDITPDSHNPYALTAAQDIEMALQQVRDSMQYNHFVLAGLCSGAHNSFQAALRMLSPSIKEAILINPLAFYWKQGDSLLAPQDSQHEADAAHYSDNVRSLNKWLSLFTSPKKLRSAFGFAMRLVRKKSVNVGKRLAAMMGVVQRSQLEKDLLLINSAGTRITLFIGETEPGYRLLLAQAGDTVRQQQAKGDMHVAIITGGDHTFSALASRQHLINLFAEHLRRYI